MLVHRLYTEADGPNLELVSPWRGGGVVIRSDLFPVIYSISKGEQPKETSVHLARIKPYCAQSAVPATGFDALYILVPKIPSRILINVASHARTGIGSLVVNAIEKHKRAPGKSPLTNLQYTVLRV